MTSIREVLINNAHPRSTSVKLLHPEVQSCVQTDTALMRCGWTPLGTLQFELLLLDGLTLDVRLQVAHGSKQQQRHGACHAQRNKVGLQHKQLASITPAIAGISAGTASQQSPQLANQHLEFVARTIPFCDAEKGCSMLYADT